ncbi:MAG: hypothetical protein ACOH1I_11290 [Gallionellaceae bacterium]|jgi:hypothetical protein
MYEPLREKLVRGVFFALYPFIIITIFLGRHEDTFVNILTKLLDFSSFMYRIGRNFVSLVRIAGWITIVLLTFTSVIALVYFVLQQNGISLSTLDPYYKITALVFDSKLAYPIIIIVIGATVAMIHIQNLEINQEKFIQEQKDRWQKEFEKNRLEEEKRRALYVGFPMKNTIDAPPKPPQKRRLDVMLKGSPKRNI